MESSQPEGASLPREGEAPVTVTVSLRVLSPSFGSSESLTLNNLPLSTTVRDVKNQITPLIPSRPTPEQQRLIHRGRPLLDPNATLQDFLQPPFDTVHTLHLVLPPGPEISNNTSSASDSTLRYRNGSNQIPSRAASNSSIPAYAPGPTAANQEHGSLTTGAQVQGRFPHNLPASQSIRPLSQLAQPGQPPREFPHTSEQIQQVRRQAEGLSQAVNRARTILNAHHMRLRLQDVNSPWADNANQTPQQPGTFPTSNVNVPASTTAPVPASQFFSNGAAQSMLISRVAHQITGLELDVQRGIAPAIDTIVRIRGQLYAMLDARYRQPSLAINAEVEGLLLRLQNVYIRAYQIRQVDYLRQPPQRVSNAGAPVQPPQSSGYYLVTGPSGEQMILALSNLPQPQVTSLQAIPVFQNAHQPVANGPAAAAAAPNGEMQNIVRQALLNQAEVRGGGNNNDNFAQNFRRFWLFLRLYFFCYLFTDSGTWERFLFVGAAAFIAFFSESTITRRFFEMMIEPIQRHLEGLIHGQPPVPSQQSGNNNANVNNPPEQRPAAAGGAEQGLRRVERAFALFIASLIPGVGERQVEVRNAAEEAARNAQQQQAREEEERARNEAQNAVSSNNNNNGLSAAEASTGESSNGAHQVEQHA